MERKQLFIPIEKFKEMLKHKELNSAPMKGFRRGHAPELLLSFLHGNEIIEQVISGELYQEMVKQIQEGYNIKDYKIHGIYIKENKEEGINGWNLVVDLEKEKIEAQSKSDKQEEDIIYNNSTTEDTEKDVQDK